MLINLVKLISFLFELLELFFLFRDRLQEKTISLLSSQKLFYQFIRVLHACGLFHFMKGQVYFLVLAHQPFHFCFEQSFQEKVSIKHVYPLLFLSQFVSHSRYHCLHNFMFPCLPILPIHLLSIQNIAKRLYFCCPFHLR